VFFAAIILMLGRRGTLARPGGTLLLGLYAVYMAGLVLAPAYLAN
jgi:Ca2+/Na+ antiporter